MNFTEICLVFTAAMSVFLLCANIFLIVRHFSTKNKLLQQKSDCDKLLAVTAHDMRSPLTAIKGFADAMLDGTADEERCGQYLALISSESDRLAKISNRLCAGDSTQLQKRAFGVCECVRKAFLLTERKAQAKDLDVSFSFSDDDEFYALADCDAVYEIILNLFENAVKYANVGGHIRWDVSQDDEYVTVTSENSCEFLPEIPDVFARGTTSGRQSDGSFGLGLYISKTLADRMDAVLFFEKRSENGTNICAFTLKLLKADEI